jgi:hypothetical protein
MQLLLYFILHRVLYHHLYNHIETFHTNRSANGLEFTDLHGIVHHFFHMNSPNSRPSNFIIPSHAKANLWFDQQMNYLPLIGIESNHKTRARRRLRLGILSADFGIHPVATLIRGFVQFVNKNRINLFCFSIDPKMSYWGINISNTVENFIGLENMNTWDAAMKIASYKIDILIDLNGHTMNSGLLLMNHKPAPLQLSFLGLPTTTGDKPCSTTFTQFILKKS